MDTKIIEAMESQQASINALQAAVLETIEAMESQQASINALQVAVLECSKTLGIVHENHGRQAELARSERRILLGRIEVLESIVGDLQRRDEGQREMVVKLLEMIQEDRGVMNIPIL